MSRLNIEQQAVVARTVAGFCVYDLGAGNLDMTRLMLTLRASSVVAIDKEEMPPFHHPDVKCIRRRFDEFERFPADGDAALVSWPVNHPNPGLVRMLDAAPIIIYIGKNTDGSACGDRKLFEAFLGRRLIAYVPDRANVVAIYGEKLATDIHGEVLNPRSKVGEEYAALQSEMLSYYQAEYATTKSTERAATVRTLIEQIRGLPEEDRRQVLFELRNNGKTV
jgi:hypothetical protein